jgi:hypothetical protein
MTSFLVSLSDLLISSLTPEHEPSRQVYKGESHVAHNTMDLMKLLSYGLALEVFTQSKHGLEGGSEHLPSEVHGLRILPLRDITHVIGQPVHHVSTMDDIETLLKHL